MPHLTYQGFLASWKLVQGGLRLIPLTRSTDLLLEKPTPLAPVGTSHTKLVRSLSSSIAVGRPLSMQNR
jgi:hypothetical protein